MKSLANSIAVVIALTCVICDGIPKTIRQTGAWEVCSGVAGICIDTYAYSCTGSTLTGKCPGASNIRCCPYPYGVNSGTCVSENVGVCTRTENCPRSVITGKCPGPSAVTCCPYSTTSSGGTYLPPKPDTSRSYGSCTTPINTFSGSCIDRAKCTGGTFNGLCPGSSSILCCVAETRSTSAVPSNPILSFSQFQRLFTNVSPTRASALYPYFLSSLSVASINSCLRLSAFAAQIGHESLGLLYFEELADGSQYQGRTDLCNTQPGDGRRYKGRGPIQLTGRCNYQNAGAQLGRSFATRPEEVGMPSGGFQATAWYWKTYVKNSDADTGSQSGFDRITIAINGCGGVISGCNGVSDRRNRWYAARNLLGC